MAVNRARLRYPSTRRRGARRVEADEGAKSGVSGNASQRDEPIAKKSADYRSLGFRKPAQ